MTEPFRKNQASAEPALPDSLGLDEGRPILNRETALARMGGDRDLFAQLALFFLDDAPQLLRELETALKVGDAKAVHHAAHSLKGLSASFEAIPAITAARSMEKFSQDGNLAECQPLLVPLRREISRLIAALQEMLQ